MIPATILEEIRARLPVSTLVGRRVRMKRAGREWRGLSPFNKEDTPSFYANDTKQFWHDFSSGKHGDVFAWLVETEGLTFPESVERLAAEAGVELPKEFPEARERAQRQRGLAEVVELASRFFEGCLAGDVGASARAYLDGREIGTDARHAFRLGYAPDSRSALREHLASSGVTLTAMAEAGLTIAPDDGSPQIDKFRDRIIFPICDARGQVVGFGGRALREGRGPKYLNSPETPLFDKGRLLYNLHRARGPAHDFGQVYVVEGNVDVLAMERSGFPNTVAPLGTALTAAQLDLLWQVVPEPTVLFDGDTAGRRAAARAIDTALPHLAPNRSLRFAGLPTGLDPDDLARSAGPDAIKRVLMASRPLVDALWQRELDLALHDTPERRASLEARLMDACGAIQHTSVRSHYRSEYRRRLSARFGRFSRAPGVIRLSPAALALMSRPVRIEDDPIGLAEEQRVAAELAELGQP